MATPATMTAGVTQLSAANLNKYISGDGTKTQIKMWYATVIFNATLQVDSTQASSGLTTGALSYNGGTNKLEITLSGFTNPPVVIVNRLSLGSNYIPAALPVSNTRVDIEFYTVANLATKATPGAADTNMDFSIIIIGD